MSLKQRKIGKKEEGTTTETTSLNNFNNMYKDGIILHPSSSMLSYLVVVLTISLSIFIAINVYDYDWKRNLLSYVSGDESFVFNPNDDRYQTSIVPKYDSILGEIIPQVLLQEFSSSSSSSSSSECMLFSSEIQSFNIFSILDVMNQTEEMRQKDQVFFMLNGKNDGVQVYWNGDEKCLHYVASNAALILNADRHRIQLNLRLLSQLGDSITSKELNKFRIAHILFDDQLWVYPGIEIGWIYQLGNIEMKTISMIPKVFSLKNFFTSQEAKEIIQLGSNTFVRSPVDSLDEPDGISEDRTSDTSFLNDSNFTREFRYRTAMLAKIPSASFVERLQLVRYKTGQFFRKHEDYFDSKQFLPKKNLGWNEYVIWTHWAANKIRKLSKKDEKIIPTHFKEGKDFFPNAEDLETFQHNILDLFLKDKNNTDYFQIHGDLAWQEWIYENAIQNKADSVLNVLLEDREYMLIDIIRSWEKHLGLKEFQYEIPKRKTNEISQYFRWIRWMKETLSKYQKLVSKKFLPFIIQAGGDLFPRYETDFQNDLVSLLLNETSKDEILKNISKDDYEWLVENVYAHDVLLIMFQESSSSLFPLLVQAWEKHVNPLMSNNLSFHYQIPLQPFKHFEPNRFATVFLYLNTVLEGGETVFPHSKQRLVTNISRNGMTECSNGLAIPAIETQAAFFYSQTPENDVDPMSLHGGCPPAQGVKFGSNSFIWNADADEGSNAWDL